MRSCCCIGTKEEEEGEEEGEEGEEEEREDGERRSEKPSCHGTSPSSSPHFGPWMMDPRTTLLAQEWEWKDAGGRAESSERRAVEEWWWAFGFWRTT